MEIKSKDTLANLGEVEYLVADIDSGMIESEDGHRAYLIGNRLYLNSYFKTIREPVTPNSATK